MAKDTKYLSLIHGTWHFDFTVPVRLKKWFKQKRIRYTLNTSDYKQDIIHFRDILLYLPVGWQKKSFKGDAYDLTPATENEKSMHPNTVKKTKWSHIISILLNYLFCYFRK